MIALLLALSTLTVQQTDSTLLVHRGIQHPAVSPSGRVAYDLDGDIWVVGTVLREGNVPSLVRPVRVTSGPSWDRQPAWSPDGETLVFSSDRNGSFDIWSIHVGGDGSIGEAISLTHSDQNDSEPTVGADGTLVFVRGAIEVADLWSISRDGEEHRLTFRDGGEVSPSFSPSGDWLVYVSVLNRRRELRVRRWGGDDDRLVLTDRAIEFPSWSTTGKALSFTTRSGDLGVWVTPTDGSYVNLIAGQAAASVWLPDEEWMLLASLPRADLGYNGDPTRLGDGPGRDEQMTDGTLWVTAAPTLPGRGLTQIPISASVDLAARNEERFDRLWSRLNQLYYGNGAGDAWKRIRTDYRPRAIRAASDSALDEILSEMLQSRPHIRQEVRGRAAVSSAHPLASAAGAEMIRRGGNVIDAAIATSFAIGVVEPDASGIGGYGEMVLFLNGLEEPVVIEFLTRVPEQAGLNNAALLVDGSLPPDGPVLANVPGTVAGMWTAWRKYGSGNLEWSELIEPAIRMAEEGFVLDESFTTTLSRERFSFEKYQSSMRLFFPDGRPLEPGDTLHNPDLAWTLRQIASGGADAFYRGEIAERLVSDLRGQGSAIALTDMARYFAVEREPISGVYHGHTVYSAAPAAGGGVSLVTKLNLLENAEPHGLYRDDARSLHAMIEAWKLTPSTAGRMGDPSLWPVELDEVLDPARARRTWQSCFDPNRTTGPSDLRRTASGEPACADDLQIGFKWGEELGECVSGTEHRCLSSGTTAFAVADADGNIVAVTQTLGTWGGNFYVTPGLGFLYNDKLRSYRTDPDEYGARLPFARHGTSIAPTVVFEGTGEEQRPRFAVAAAGNAWITSAVYQMLVAMVDQGLGPQDALELPRFLVGSGRGEDGGRETLVQLEDGYAPAVLRELRRLGHEVQLISLRGELRMGYGAAVLIDGDVVRAGGDPRRSGGAEAIR